MPLRYVISPKIFPIAHHYDGEMERLSLLDDAIEQVNVMYLNILGEKFALSMIQLYFSSVCILFYVFLKNKISSIYLDI